MDAQGMQVPQESNVPMKNSEEATLEAELK